MEKKFTDLFKEVGGRLRSPLIYSFIIAWLVTNWRIVIGLMFYKSQQLQLDGYTSFLDMIDKNRTFIKFWGLPIVVSLVYTFAFPIIRNVISAYNAWNFRWGSTWALAVAKEGGVSFSKYIELKTRLQQSIEEVENIHKSESQITNENEKLRNDTEVLKRRIENEVQSLRVSEDIKAALVNELSILKEKSEIKTFNGAWKMKFKNGLGQVKTERITISNGDVSYSNAEAKYESLFKLKTCVYNPNTNEYVVVFERVKDPNASGFSEIFRPQDETMTFLKNFEEKGIILELEKIII
ncbi:hypothetical protein A3860_14755 [Niastella vici]|uniref:Uncharacterized protein n=1 Tax=Niastella vici TaxID=1703345 RepID=A0A1V9G5D2_9BACT|nr:hypothetical protein [Niastella vici]OQP65851.1 hypothetical protein A3860_14755 [Niastella vici]